MGVGTRLGGAYKDAICPICFGHNYRYYQDLAGLDKDLSAGRGKFCEIFSIRCEFRWKSVGIGSIKSADFRIKKVVFENIRKRLKTI